VKSKVFRTKSIKIERGENMKIRDLAELVEHEFIDLYDAEKQISQAIPDMIKVVKTPKLKEALDKHLHQTEEQIMRLVQAATLLGIEYKGGDCAGMKGIIKEGSDLVEKVKDGYAVDAGVICAAQKIEHYEISVYGSLISYLQLLGQTEVKEILAKNLEEEKEADSILSKMAEAEINVMAAEEI
jgi:ferritin-like metal-binding protein YciE